MIKEFHEDVKATAKLLGITTDELKALEAEYLLELERLVEDTAGRAEVRWESRRWVVFFPDLGKKIVVRAEEASVQLSISDGTDFSAYIFQRPRGRPPAAVGDIS